MIFVLQLPYLYYDPEVTLLGYYYAESCLCVPLFNRRGPGKINSSLSDFGLAISIEGRKPFASNSFSIA